MVNWIGVIKFHPRAYPREYEIIGLTEAKCGIINAEKWDFPLRISSVKLFSKEILNRKLHVLCNEHLIYG